MPRQKKKYNERIDLGYGADGKRIRKWVRADSATEFKELKRQAVLSAAKNENLSDITFKEYSERWLQVFKANKSNATYMFYKKALPKFKNINQKKLRDITSTDLQILINDNDTMPRTCKTIRTTLNQIFKKAMKDHIIAYNPVTELELPSYKAKETRFLSDEELKKILQIPFEPQERLFIDVLRNTGMRPSEALALQWNDIKGLNIHVSHAFEYPNGIARMKSTKTGVERDIPITQAFADTLNNAQKQGLFVFLVDGHPFNYLDYARLYRHILNRINRAFGGNKHINALGGLTLYSFRHTFATGLYYNGVRAGLISTKAAAKIMGHSEEMFIKTYTHIKDDEEHYEEVLEKMACVQ